MATFCFLGGLTHNSKFIKMSTNYLKIKSMSPQFVVADLERSLDFYTRELGFEIDFRYEDFYAGIIKGSYTIHLKLGYGAIEKKVGKAKNEHLDLCFAVADINSLFEAIKKQPINIIQPLREMPYGREFYITDPDGYILSFLE
jgi:catechol 2,3-dioxygenase-like lactoylglutathione lyase family enzyme